MFLYVFSEEDKEKLLLNGYSFIKEVCFGDKKGYLFNNNGNKINFNNTQVLYTNKLTF